MMRFDHFLLGFLVCALIAGGLAVMYLDYVKREEGLLRQQMAIEMFRDLDAAKLRHLLGNVSVHIQDASGPSSAYLPRQR
jgi:hypothetical protein